MRPLALVLVVAAGTVLAHSLGSQQRLPDAPLLLLSEEIRIDAAREQMVNFSDVRIGPRGQILLNQNQDGFLLLFDSTGKKLRSIGKRGDGPGEFRRVTSYGWFTDSIWAYESGAARVTLFSAGGQYLRQFDVSQIPASSVHKTPPLRAYAAHAFFDNSILIEASGAAEVRGVDNTVSSASTIVVIGADARVQRVVAPVKSPPAMLVRVNGTQSSFMPAPFAPPSLQGISADGARIGLVEITQGAGTTANLSLVIIRPSGDTLLSRQYSVTGEGIPQRVLDSATESRARRITDASQRAAYQTFATRSTLRVYPPVREIMIGRDDTYWLMLRSPDSRRHWLMFDRAGTPVGKVILNQNQTLLAAERGRIWVSESDTDGLRHLVRFGAR